MLDRVAPVGAPVVHGVPFPAEPTAADAVRSLCEGGVDYVRLGLDLEKETIVVQEKDNISLNDLARIDLLDGVC